MATAETPATPAKDKAAKFKELANSRVGKALNAIALIGNLAAKNNYDYTEEQVSKIESALNAEVATLMNRFRKPDQVKTSGFSL